MKPVIAIGTDVSYYQGNTINWNVYKEAGYSFTIIKCSIKMASGKINEADYFDLHFENSGKADVQRGVYHYARAKSVVEATEEAQFIINMLKKRGITPADVPFGVWYDQEDAGCRTLGHAVLFQCLLAFKKVINEAGYGCGLYTNKDWLTNTWKYQDIVNAKIPIWMAQYNSTITFAHPEVIDMWQFTSSGQVPGIVNSAGQYVAVDIDRLYTPVNQLFAGQTLGDIENPTIVWTQKGDKWYCTINGVEVKSQWVHDKGVWYYVGADGAMLQEQWLNENGIWYYFNSDGSLMGTGWKFINGYWYYFVSGKMQTGWLQLEDKWYYLFPVQTNGCPAGSAAIGLHCIDDDIYAFDNTGLMYKNAAVVVYADANGVLSMSK